MSIRRKKPRVCLVLNIAPYYRTAVYKALDDIESVDYFFYSGDVDMQISTLCNLKNLSGFKGLLKNKFKGTKLIWQKGWFKLLFGRYDAFIVTGNPGIRSNWLLTIFARMMGKKVYQWSHGLYGHEVGKQKFINLLYMKLASAIFLYGNYAKRHLLNGGYKKQNISVVYNSLDVEKQQALRERKEDNLFMRNYFGNNAPVVIFLGRLTKQKSLELLIDALGILKVQGIECNCILVGEGEREESLRKRAEEVGILDQVWFYGSTYDEDMIATLFKLSTICVSPGNVGLTAMHSLGYGTPVITHNNFRYQMPEFEAIRRGISGDFFQHNDAIALSDKLYRWIESLKDETIRKKCTEACYKMVDTVYNPKNQAAIINNRILRDLGYIK